MSAPEIVPPLPEPKTPDVKGANKNAYYVVGALVVIGLAYAVYKRKQKETKNGPKSQPVGE